MKRIVAIIGILALSGMFAGCGGGNEAPAYSKGLPIHNQTVDHSESSRARLQAKSEKIGATPSDDEKVNEAELKKEWDEVSTLGSFPTDPAHHWNDPIKGND